MLPCENAATSRNRLPSLCPSATQSKQCTLFQPELRAGYAAAQITVRVNLSTNRNEWPNDGNKAEYLTVVKVLRTKMIWRAASLVTPRYFSNISTTGMTIPQSQLRLPSARRS